MVAESADSKVSEDLLRRILLRFLLASAAVDWPGVDGLTEDDILSCYPLASAKGNVPGKRELLRRHPNLSAEIEALFARNGWRDCV